MIKNNLSDVLKRQTSTVTSGSSSQKPPAKNKFKPAVGSAPRTNGPPSKAASNSSIHRASATPLPTFSTPGFNKPRDLSSARTPSIIEIDAAEYELGSQAPPPPATQTQTQTQSQSQSQSQSQFQSQFQSHSPYPSSQSKNASGSSSGSNSARKKRPSSELPPIEIFSPKRPRNERNEKENEFSRLTRDDVRDKGKGRAKGPSSPISSQTSPRANRRRVIPVDDERPWDSFELSMSDNPFEGLSGFPKCSQLSPPIRTTPPPPRPPPPPEPVVESKHVDLNDKSMESLKYLLEWNTQALGENYAQISLYFTAKKGDLFVLEQIKSCFEGRKKELERLIKAKEAAERAYTFVSPAPAGPSRPAPPLPPVQTYDPPSTDSPSSQTALDDDPPTRETTPVIEDLTESTVAQTSHYFTGPGHFTRAPVMSSDTVINIEDEVEIADDDENMWNALHSVSESVFDLESASSSKSKSPYDVEIMAQLRRTFNLESFRTNQYEAIVGTLSGKDVFVLMPTGGGKSLCYQLPAVCKSGKTRGITFVVSPLKALMTDQVEGMEKKGIDVLLWNSERTQEDVREIVGRLSGYNKPCAVYITPEKIKESSLLRNKLRELYQEGQIARFVIDEAHCISSWGRDFREAYQELHVLREEYPTVPIMALTATANRTVADDIRKRLRMKPDCVCLTQSFNRPNLFYSVVPKPTGKKGKNLEAMAAFIKGKHAGKSGVVYCFSRNDCEKVAQTLRREHGLSAKHFHAGMDAGDRATTQSEWQSGRVLIIVATIAFGMGIDKPDVRFVIHHSTPKSMDGYYQETGRAGRDGKPADCLLYYDYGDCKKLITLIRQDRSRDRPSPANIKRQEDAVHEVIEFCHNNTECRRSYVLRYFGETFSPTDCKNSCDICVGAGQLTTVDATTQALTVLQLVETLSDGPENVSENHCQNVYLGSNLKEIRDRGHDRHPYFGAGKGQPREMVKRLFSTLMIGGGLEQVSKENGAGWHVNYVVLGPKAAKYRSGEKVMVSFVPSGAARTNSA